jgi:hypothetical protein
MGEVAERTEGSLTVIRESLDLVHAQIGSMDARLGLLDTTYQQVAVQLDPHSRAVSDHTRVMDAFERRQESMAQHLAATAKAVSRIVGYKLLSEAEEEDDGESMRPAGKGILRLISIGGCRGVPTGGTFHPGSSSSARPPDASRSMEMQYIDLPCRTPRHGPPAAPDQQTSGDHGRAADHSSGKVPIKMNFPTFNGEFPRIWRDKCLDYF